MLIVCIYRGANNNTRIGGLKVTKLFSIELIPIPSICTISFCRRNEALVKELSSPALDVQDIAFPTKYAQPFWQQCLACSWKQHRSYWRNPYYNVFRIILSTLYGLLFGTICWRFGQHRYYYYYYYYILSRLHLMKCLINYNFHNP